MNAEQCGEQGRSALAGDAGNGLRRSHEVGQGGADGAAQLLDVEARLQTPVPSLLVGEIHQLEQEAVDGRVRAVNHLLAEYPLQPGEIFPANWVEEAVAVARSLPSRGVVDLLEEVQYHRSSGAVQCAAANLCKVFKQIEKWSRLHFADEPVENLKAWSVELYVRTGYVHGWRSMRSMMSRMRRGMEKAA